MKTYFRILKFVKPYWRHLTLSLIFTVLFALLNGVSVYLTIPLLDTLFQESIKKEAVEQTSTVEKASSILPDWIVNIGDDISKTFNAFVFSGNKTEALMKICFMVLFAFFFKNIFSYLQAYFMSYVEYGAMKDLRDLAHQHLH
ncbi:MAG TPA: ABC transporter ATP-binding protein, partial [Ignavibacteriaceae bacterium]